MDAPGPAEETSCAAAVPPAGPPQRLRAPVNLHRWSRISFLHWRFDPDLVAGLLPPGTRVLTYEGAAWVGVTPFVIRVLLPPGMPAVPGRSTFPETNVRTYVATPDGRQALWFLRMEVTERWFVLTLRSLGLPYVRRRMTVEEGGGRIRYTSKASRLGAGGHDIAVRPGARIEPLGGGPRDRFLTAWWGALHRRGPLLLHTPAAHPPWPLHSATVETCDVEALFASAGLPAPEGPPVAHYSPGVPVRIGWPQVAG